MQSKQTLIKLCTFSLLTFILPLAHAQTEPERNPLIFTVGEQAFRFEDIKKYVSTRPAMRTEAFASRQGFKAVATDMAMDQVLMQEGPAMGITPQPDQTTQSEAYIFSVFKKLIPPCELPTEEAAKNFYTLYRNKFSTPLYVRTSRVFFAESTQVEGKPAETYLIESAKKISDNAQNFDDLVAIAKKHNFSSEKLGDAGFTPMEEDAPLIKTLSKAKIGDLVGPIKSNGFIYLFKVTERREPVSLSWEEAKASAPEKARLECDSIKLKTKRAELFKKYKVQFNDDAINAL